MLLLNFKLLRKSLESDLEPRIAIVSMIIICISLYSFRIDVAIIAFIIALIFSRGRILFGIFTLLPLISLFVLFSAVFGGIKKIPAMISLFSIGFLIIGIHPEEIAYALMYFRFPPSFCYYVCISMRLLRVIARDLEYVSDCMRLEGIRGFRYYLKILKALATISVLRSISIAESMYSRGIDLGRRIVIVKNPGAKDLALLTSSILLLLWSYNVC